MGASQSSPSPFALPRSPASSPSKLCEFSEKQTEKFDEVIHGLKELEFQMLRESKAPEIPADLAAKLFQLPSFTFDTKKSYLKDSDINEHRLLIKRILCSMLIDILKEYQAILKKIFALCRQCRSGEADGVEGKINDIIEKDLIEAQTMLNSFNQISDPYMQSQSLKPILDNLVETNQMFEDVDRIKSEMMVICMGRQDLQQLRIGALTANRFGGKSSRSTSKKRKQMKMSKHVPKTRNSKKKYKNCKSVKMCKK